ncbi:hypothetical protein [Candidatus Nitrososphaera gargensis]|uniref:hypothetical protein n=1 Tax=Candidatus Nitrososphaera gargensis TaxID=497727 RepID=UPI0011E572A3|nr:hypothetical protein [Candidatus Nitrososphaera gargensis]
MVDNANRVWHKAGVTFVVRSLDYKEVPDEVLNSLDSFNNTALKQFGKAVLADRFEDGIIDVVFLRSFSNGIEDLAIIEGNISIAFLSELESIDFISWTLAHELGHTLGLLDVFEFDNLMIRVDGTSMLRFSYRNAYLPSNLTDQQIVIIRNTIEAKSFSIS